MNNTDQVHTIIIEWVKYGVVADDWSKNAGVNAVSIIIAWSDACWHFLWCHFKGRVYVTKPWTRKQPDTNQAVTAIHFESIMEHTLEKSKMEWKAFARYVSNN